MVKKEWHALDLSTLPSGEWLAADPSLAAFGLVHFEIRSSQVYILHAITLATDQTPAGGWESNLTRALYMRHKIADTVDDWIPGFLCRAVQESPPTGGGAMMRPESTMLGGVMFRLACADWGLENAPLVTPQSHKKLTCGNHIAKKKEHHDAIRNLLPQIHNSQIIKNEALRDALSVGLYAAHREIDD